MSEVQVFHKYGNVVFTKQDNILGGGVSGYKVTGLPRVTWLTFTRTGSQVRCDYGLNFGLGEPILLDPCDDLRVTLECFVSHYLENWIAQINMDRNMYRAVADSIYGKTTE